ncbi:MAG: ABC transporter permease [Erysipelotrichaceae bacterium]
MKQFITVLKFELSSYFKSKGYLVTTILMCALIVGSMFIPTIISSFKGDDDPEEKKIMAIYDENKVITDPKIIEGAMPNTEWKFVETKEALETSVKDETAEGGFIVKSNTQFEYYVVNSSVSDSNSEMFKSVMSTINRYNLLNEKGYDYNEVNAIYNVEVTGEKVILGTDGASNFMYTYILIFALYAAVIFYGQQVSIAVTNEKSNKSIEVLITSANPNALIFGKVLAGAIAGVFQIGLVLISAFAAYHFAADSLNHMLDFLFDIPPLVMGSFAIFGVLGYLLYAFMFGCAGAMVSKVEDSGKASTPIMLIYVMTFMLAMFSLDDPNGLLLNVSSYIPFSSFMTMFLRTAMGTASILEVVISASILFVSVILVGFLAAKIYRMGTLRYGNPMTWKEVFNTLTGNKFNKKKK